MFSKIIKVNEIDTTNKIFSVVSRSQENTTSAIHYVGSQVVNVLTI